MHRVSAPFIRRSLTLRQRGQIIVVLLAAILLAAALASLTIGAVSATPSAIIGALLAHGEPVDQTAMVIWNIRLPRIILAALAGSALATSGALLQGLFRNPLADPGLSGVSAGAMLGAIASIVLGNHWLPLLAIIPQQLALGIAAFTGALAAMGCLYGIATRRGRTSVATMLLAGVGLAAFASALAGLLLFASTDQQLRDFTFWNLGSMSGASWSKVGMIAAPVIIALGLALRLARGLNALALGEASAFYAGTPSQPIKRLCVLLVAILTGSAVAVSGMIGFVGIVVPHLLRLIHGADHRFILPASALSGAILMLLADGFTRTVVAPAELPVGIVTAAIGAPFFLWLLLSRRHYVDM